MTATPAMLVVDIGNTSTSLAVAHGLKLSSVQRTPSGEPALKLRTVPKRAVIASVKPGVNKRWEKFLKKQGVAEILWVNHTVNLGVPVSYPKPETIGADRLANACEAAADYGTPVVVCDFGTALTFDIVKKKEGYVGGIICPGLPLMFDYLAEKTALLPHIKPVKTKHVVGKSTEEAGMPFYSQKVAYSQTFSLAKTSGAAYKVKLNQWNGSVAEVRINGQPAGLIAWQPNELDVTPLLNEGANEITVKITGSLKNTFGFFYQKNDGWIFGPGSWNNAPEKIPAASEYFLMDYGMMEPFTLVEIK